MLLKVQPGFNPTGTDAEHVQELPKNDEEGLKKIMEGTTLKKRITDPLMSDDEIAEIMATMNLKKLKKNNKNKA